MPTRSTGCLWLLLLAALLQSCGPTNGDAERDEFSPMLEVVARVEGREGAPIQVDIQTSHDEGRSPIIRAESIPEGASFEQVGVRRARFEWTPGYEQSGSYQVGVKARWDGGQTEAEASFVVAVADTNRAPSVDPLEELRGQPGELFAHRVRATDPDGDELRFEARLLPDGVSLSRDSGLLEWMPGRDDIGEHPIQIAVVDDGVEPLETLASGRLVIQGENRPPSIEPPGTVPAAVGGELRLVILANDPDGDALRFAAEGLPEGALLGEDDGLLTWTPSIEAVGRHEITLVVSDDGSPPLAARSVLFVVVRESNQRPAFVQPEESQGREGEPLEIRFQATDPDGDALHMQALDLPEGARFEAEERTLYWTPDYGQEGVHAYELMVTDDGAPPLTATLQGVILVAHSNRAPVIEEPEGRTTRVDSPLLLRFGASDPDADAIWFLPVSLPTGAWVDRGSGELRWTPSAGQVGDHRLVVGVRDDGAPPLASQGSVDVRVLPSVDPEEGLVCEVFCDFALAVGCAGIDECVPTGREVAGERGCCRPPDALDAQPCDPGAQPAECPDGQRCDPAPPGSGFNGVCAALHPFQDPDSVPRVGRPLQEVLDSILPEDPGPIAIAPQLQVYPTSGAYFGPFNVRLCIEDANGVLEVDTSSLRVSLQERSVLDQLIWRRVAQHKICAQVGNPADTLTRPGPSWITAGPGPVRVEARVLDHSGLEASAIATYEEPDLAPVRFTDVTAESGLAAGGWRGNSHSRGVVFFDYDLDGYPDLYVANGDHGSNRLYRNQQDGTFRDVTLNTPLGLAALSSAAVLAADYDNDGDPDLYVTNDHPVFNFGVQGVRGERPNPVPGELNYLFRNDGDGQFVDVTEAAGLRDLTETGRPFRSIAGAWGDYDGDGCPDLYLVHWRFGGEPDPEFDPDRLYRNRCDGSFEDVTAAAGLDDRDRDGLAVLFTDLDDDGRDDIYLVNIFGSLSESITGNADFGFGSERSHDILWLNQGDGTFRDATAETGVGPHAGLGMGIDLADPDHDGDFDLYITDLNGPVADGNVYYRNLLAQEGTLRYEERAFEEGDRPLTGDLGWGTFFADFNNDGWEDLFYAGDQSRWMWLNNGEGGFTAVAGPRPADFADTVGLPDMDAIVIGAATADYDRDGDLDIVVIPDDILRPSLPPMLWRNDSETGHHWFELRLHGALSSGTEAIGATVVLTAGPDAELVMRRRVLAGHSAQSQSDQVLHFGLGQLETVSRLDVYWPDGAHQVLENLAVDQLLDLHQGGE